MDASGSGSGSKKNKSVADAHHAKVMKKVFDIIKAMIREREEAHELDKTFIQKLAERNLLERVKKPEFNIDEEIRKVDEELHIADVAKQAWKVTEFERDEFGVGPSEDTSSDN